MKKILAGMSMALLVGAFATGCSKNKSESETPATATPAETGDTATPAEDTGMGAETGAETGTDTATPAEGEGTDTATPAEETPPPPQ